MFDDFETEGFELRVQRTFAHLICAARTWLELGAFIQQTSDRAGDRYALTLLYKHAMADNTMTTKEPVTVSGWYELEDGRVQRFSWRSGRLRACEVVAGWTDVPSESERLSDSGSRRSR